MNSSELQLLLKEGEGLIVEFKERFSNKIDRDIVAFANSNGGKILLGVGDHGNIVAEKLTNNLKAKINDLARNCEPSISIKKIEQIDQVIAIDIEESNQKPHSCSAGYFRRLDAATQKMNQSELKVLFNKIDNSPSFEEIENREITYNDISKTKIQAFLSEAKIQLEQIAPKEILKSLGLATQSGIKNAAVLFFAKQPRHFILQCQMTLVAFKGTDRVHIYDRLDVQDDLLTQYREAMLFLRKHLNVRSEIVGVNRQDICEIPIEVLREAVANAIIH